MPGNPDILNLSSEIVSDTTFCDYVTWHTGIILNLFTQTANGNVNRAHIGAVLTEKGYTPSIQEAFRTLLSPICGLYVPPRRLPVFETIEFIRSIGAVPVLAHPFLQLDETGLRSFLDKAKTHGLIGMETLYSTYDEKTTALSRAIAHEYGLCESGGSDFHGERKPDIALGTGKGNLAVPYEFLGKLKAFIDK